MMSEETGHQKVFTPCSVDRCIYAAVSGQKFCTKHCIHDDIESAIQIRGVECKSCGMVSLNRDMQTTGNTVRVWKKRGAAVVKTVKAPKPIGTPGSGFAKRAEQNG